MNEDLSEQLRQRQAASKGVKPKKAAEAFHRSSDNFAKYTTYLHRDLIAELKVRALTEGCSAADIITELVEAQLDKPSRKPADAKKAQQKAREKRRRV